MSANVQVIEGGEHEVSAGIAPGSDLATLGAISRAELDQQLVTARAFPRSLKRFVTRCREGALMSEGAAEACSYILPRGGKNIEGPSIRFAEVLYSSWPNSNLVTRIMDEGSEFVTVMAVFHDLEMNSKQGAEVRRRITDKSNKRFNADMISVTIAAAQSIARRNVILAGIPRAYWWDIYEETRTLARGDIKSLKTRRGQALDWFAKKGVTQQMVTEALGVGGVEDIGLDELLVLTGMKTAITEGALVETVFAPKDAPAGKPKTEAPQTKAAAAEKKGKKADRAAEAKPEPITLDQATFLADAIKETGIELNAVLARLEVGSLEEIAKADYDKAGAVIVELSEAK